MIFLVSYDVLMLYVVLLLWSYVSFIVRSLCYSSGRLLLATHVLSLFLSSSIIYSLCVVSVCVLQLPLHFFHQTGGGEEDGVGGRRRREEGGGEGRKEERVRREEEEEEEGWEEGGREERGAAVVAIIDCNIRRQ